MFAHQLFGTGSRWEVRHLNLCLTACVKIQRRFPNEWISRRVTSAAPSAPLAEPKWIFQPNKLCFFFFFFTRNDHFFYSVGAKQAATLFRLLKKKSVMFFTLSAWMFNASKCFDVVAMMKTMAPKTWSWRWCLKTSTFTYHLELLSEFSHEQQFIGSLGTWPRPLLLRLVNDYFTLARWLV